MYNQIEQIVYDESPYLVIDYSPYRYGVGDSVHGFHVSPLGAYNLFLQTADGLHRTGLPLAAARPASAPPARPAVARARIPQPAHAPGATPRPPA